MIEEGMGVKKELEEKVRSLHHRLKQRVWLIREHEEVIKKFNVLDRLKDEGIAREREEWAIQKVWQLVIILGRVHCADRGYEQEDIVDQ